jgi:cytidyltransferase-like protein
MRILVFGAFDLLHLGHIRFLKWCARLGEVHVGLATDELVADYKRQPIQSYETRKAALAELPWVHEVLRKTEHDAKPLIHQVDPQLIVAGSDWYDSELLGGYLASIQTGIGYLEDHDIGLVFYPNDRCISTTKILETIRERL